MFHQLHIVAMHKEVVDLKRTILPPLGLLHKAGVRVSLSHHACRLLLREEGRDYNKLLLQHVAAHTLATVVDIW
jgi:hypothetical protein